MLLYSNSDHLMSACLVLEDLSSRCRIPHVIWLNSHSLWSPFGWSTIGNFSEGPGFSIGPFQKVQLEMIYFPYVVMKCRRELSKNCSIHGKNREISGPHNFWTPVQRNITDAWNWNWWTLFDSEIEVGGLSPLAPPAATPLTWDYLSLTV